MKQSRRKLPKPKSHKPLAVHFLSIPPHTKEKEDEEAADDVDPAIVKYGAVIENYYPPGVDVVDLIPMEGAVEIWVWEIGRQDVDFYGEQADGQYEGDCE